MTTQQPNLVALAKQGDAQAIAALMNRSLQSKGITVSASLESGVLRVTLEAEKLPEQSTITAYVEKGIRNLGCPAIQMIRIYGQPIGEMFPLWEQEIQLIPDFAPLPTAALTTSDNQFAQGEVEQHQSEIAAETFTPKSQPAFANEPDSFTNQTLKRNSFRSTITPPSPRPRTFLVPSILITLFAFMPLGIAAIIFAAQVETKYNNGDYEGAKSASKNAKLFCIIGGAIAAPIYLLFFGIFGLILVSNPIGAKATRAKEVEAKQYIGSINRAEQAYFLETNQFTSTLADLGLGLQSETLNYEYDLFTADGRSVRTTATPKKSGLRSYTGAVYVITKDARGSETTISKICISDRPTRIAPTMPQLVNGQIYCPLDSSPLP